MDSRKEHINWCKKRALELVESGQPKAALESIYSDLKKHSETMHHPAINQGFMLQLYGKLQTEKQIRVFIEEFLI